MSDIAVRTIGLGKMYHIGGEREAYRTLRDALVHVAKRPLERIRHPGAATHISEELWALRDVDLEVGHGQVLGIIGPNGSGKSTLLKVLSRITKPTEGKVQVSGRVASLLEVGTGFHPELTGRENILLNGAILGMRRSEIKARFDDIVEFSGIGRFLDTPVKRYSSGMYVRLAFAVAAHLDPEVLIIDEVLAVGDAAFQKKCLGKMEDVAGGGRTVLFVSHNMSAVTSLCTRAIWLEDGRIRASGSAEGLVSRYLREVTAGDRGAAEIVFPDRPADRSQFTRMCTRTDDGVVCNRFAHSESFVAELEFVVRSPLRDGSLYWMLQRSDGVEVVGSGQEDLTGRGRPRQPGRYVSRVRFPGGVLNGGFYRYRVALRQSGRVEAYGYGGYVEIVDDTTYGSARGGRDGVMLQILEWTDEKLDG